MTGPPIYVINLDEDTGRMDRISRQLREQGLPFTRFSAFRGRDIPAPWKAQFEDPRIGAGEVGCYASHLQVMADMLASEDPIRVILEDDAFLSPHFADLLGALPDSLPGDWDIVRFSTQLRYPVVRVAALPHGFGIYSYSRLPFSTVGYMINRRFASSFTRPRERAHPLDAHFQHPSMFGNFTTYGVEPGPVRYARGEASSVGAEGRTRHRRSRLRRNRLIQSEIHAIGTHGPVLRMRCHLRWLKLKLTSKPPYSLQELELAHSGRSASGTRTTVPPSR